jgi:VCBS repeat-containing protein
MAMKLRINGKAGFAESSPLSLAAESDFTRIIAAIHPPATAAIVSGPGPQQVAPTLTNNGDEAVYTEAVDDNPDPLIFIAPEITVGDVDSATLASATITFTSGYHSDQDILGFVNDNATLYGNIAGSFDSMTGTMVFTSSGATATKAQWQNALRHVTYTNPSDTPNISQRRLDFTISDGTDTSAAAKVKIGIISRNDSPSGSDHTFTIPEDMVVVLSVSDLGYSDPENNPLARVSFQSWDGGTLYFDTDGLAGPDEPQLASTTRLYSGGDFSTGRLYFVPTFESSGTGAAHITFTVWDQGIVGPATFTPDPTPNTLTYNITPVDDVPETVGLGGDYVTYVVGAAPEPVDLGRNAIVTDDDSTDFGGGHLNVQLTNSAGSEDVLGFDVSLDSGVTLSNGTNVGSIVSVDGTPIGTISSNGVGAAALTVDFNAAATPAAVTTLVHALSYQDTSLTPTLGMRNISIQISDGDNPSPPTLTTHMTVATSDAAAIAQPDYFTTHESNLLLGNVFDDNGSGFGPDSDPDSPMVTVETINGTTGVVGTQISLPSGALLTLNADGTFRYDGREAFDSLPWAGSGAAVTSTSDNFTYTLANGTTTTVSIQIIGDDTNDTIVGTPGNDRLTGGAGNDLIDGLAGADQMFGGTGDDRYIVDNPNDFGAENPGEGNDTIYTSVNFSLGTSSIETISALDLNSTVGLTLAGNASANTLIGAEGGDYLFGGVGNDALEGHGGNDLLMGGSNDDFLDGGEGDDALYGEQGNDILVGGSGNDYLVGGAGIDGLYGGVGNDTYFFDDAGDFAIELTGEGQDIAYTIVSHTLAAGSEIEILSAFDTSSTAPLDLHGNELDNQIWANAAANYVTGGAGDDSLLGLDGNDTLMGGEGTDYLAGGQGNDALYGEAGNDLLIGEDGNDYLDGGAGGDGMYGGAGNDSYFVDDGGDYAVESASGGTDALYTSVSYSLAAGNEIETIAVRNPASTNAINMLGNEFNNQLLGNEGVNNSNGGDGNDTLFGYGGNDGLGGGNGADYLSGGQGNDALYGEAGNDLLVGDEGNDYIVGGAGGDGMYGGTGNDTFFIDDALDYVIELGGGGQDIAYATVSHTLAAGSELEILSALDNAGTAAIDLHGNELDNQIWGNGGANYLTGGGGNDVLVGFGGDDLLIGGTGNDYLDGGAGADTFAFTSALNAATNVDMIAGFSSADDVIVLDHAVFAGLGPGPLAAGAFATGAAAHDADDRIIYDSATGAIYFDSDGNGAGAAIQFASVAPGTALTFSDFYVA